MSASHAYECKMCIKQSGNHMDTQYNTDILLLCWSERLHYQAITNGWPE